MARRTIKVSVTRTVNFDPETSRGAIFEGIMDMSDLNKKLNANYSLDIAAKFPLYKWFPDVGEVRCCGHYYKPPNSIKARKAAITDASLDDLLINHLPSWAEFPDRQPAVNSFTARKTALELSRISEVQGYHPGRVFRVIPVLGARIVVAPTPHFRDSFQYALDEWGISAEGRGLLDKLEGSFFQLFYACGMDDGYPQVWSQFLSVLNDIADEKIRPQRSFSKHTHDLYTTLIDNKTNLSEFLNATLSPSKNGFKLIDYAGDIQPDQYPDNEVWTASPCLLIDEALFDDHSQLKLMP